LASFIKLEIIKKKNNYGVNETVSVVVRVS